LIKEKRSFYLDLEGDNTKKQTWQPMKILHAFLYDLKKQMHFLMWHEKALIGWDGKHIFSYDQWEILHAFFHDMKRQMHFLMWPMKNSSCISSCDMKKQIWPQM
jgi:hypothetical protein